MTLKASDRDFFSKRQLTASTDGCESQLDAMYGATEALLWLLREYLSAHYDRKSSQKLFISTTHPSSYLSHECKQHERVVRINSIVV